MLKDNFGFFSFILKMCPMSDTHMPFAYLLPNFKRFVKIKNKLSAKIVINVTKFAIKKIL